MDQITSFQLIRLLRLLFGILGFIGLFSLDLLNAWKSKAHWVPQGALVLSALSLQLLDLLDTQTVSITDYPASKEYDLERVLRNELLVDGGRVMVCVYMGYLLPQMARSPSKRQLWSDIGALALSVLTNIFSELYAFKELYSNLRIDHIPVNPLSIASRVCTMVCAILLFLLLGSAVFAGRTIYDLVLEKIPLVVRREPEGYLTGSYSPEYVEQDVFQSWVVAWVCRPDYVIARSVLASSVGVVVTASFGCFAAEWITQNYQVLHFGDGIDWFRHTVTAFMTLLILMGWIIICFRWMLAILYFPGKYKIPNQRSLHLEDFWIRHIFEIMDDIQFRPPAWDKHVSGGGFLENLKFLFLEAIRAHKWLLHLLLCLQRPVILFSKLCCFLSEKIVFVDKTRPLIVGAGDSDFAGFGEALKVVKMPGETEQYLLDASLKALKKTKALMEEGRKKGMESEGLIQFLRSQSIDQNFEGLKFLETLRARLDEVGNSAGFEYLKKFSWKLTTLSIIEVLLELEGPFATDAVEHYSQAYDQAYDFLDLLDNPAGTDKNLWGQLLTTAAYKKFKIITQRFRRNSAPSCKEIGTMQEARQKVMELQKKSEKHVSCNPNDSVDWGFVAANNILEKVCTIILENNTSSETAHCAQLMSKVRKILADILAIVLKEKVGIELVNNCRGWAEILEDEKIRASVYIAGKLRGVSETLNGVMQPERADGAQGVWK